MSEGTEALFADARQSGAPQIVTGSAYISADGLYRYSLTRELRDCDCLIPWLEGVGNHSPSCASVKTCTFVMLNPSTADAEQDDPTIRRCMGFARTWGFGRLKVVNLYAYRATKPNDLWLADDPVGPENDHVLSIVFGGSDLLIAAWGAHARADRVAKILARPIRPRVCLGVTKAGAPRHPLYLKGDLMPRPLAGEEAEAA